MTHAATLRYRSPLHAWHAANAARFVERSGGQVPASYADPGREANAVRTGVALIDLSHSPKCAVLGTGVTPFAQALTSSAACQLGGVAEVNVDGPVLACRLASDQLLLLAEPSCRATTLVPAARAASQHLPDLPLVFTDATSAYAVICLCAAEPAKLLAGLTSFDLAALPKDRCAETGVAGVHAVLVRSGHGLHILVTPDLAEYVWERLVEVGRSEGLVVAGLDALPRGTS